MNQSISWGYVFITSWNIWKMDGGYCCHGYIYNTLSGCQSSLKFSDFTQVFYNSPQVTCHFNQTQYADSAQCSLWSYSLIMQAYLRSSRRDQWYSLWLDHTAIYSTRGEHANNYITDVVQNFMRLLVLFLLYSRAIVDLQLSNYLRNQSLSPLKLCVRIPLMARSIRYNILWKSLLVTCSRSVVSSCFLYQ